MKASIKYLLIYIGLTLVGGVLFGLPATIVDLIADSSSSASNELNLSGWTMSFVIFGSQLIPFLVFWKKKWCDYSFLKNQKYIRILLCLIIGWIGCYGIDVALSDYLPKLNWDQEIMGDIKSMMGNPLGLIACCVMAPILEEGVFRGTIERKLLEKDWNPWWAIVISALFFSLVHMNITQGLIAMILGVFLGWIYYRTRNIWLCVFVHALNNTFSTVMYLIYGDAAESDYSLPLSGNLVILVIGIAVIFLAASLINKMAPDPVVVKETVEETVGEMSEGAPQPPEIE